MTRWISRQHAVAAGTAAAILVGCAATSSWAQVPDPTDRRGGGGQFPYQGPQSRAGPPSNPDAPNGNPDRFDETRYNIFFRNVTPGRTLTRERLEFEAIDLERRRRRMGPEELRADLNRELEKAGVDCSIRGFKRIGMTPGAQSIYETACESGPGYVLVNGVDPSATSCLVLAGAGASALRRDPAAQTGAQCTMRENQNGPQLVGDWAREAGVTCKVDQAEWLGATDAGYDMYEVGCQGSEGFWLEKAASGWTLRGCLQVNDEGLNCRFTDRSEQRAWMRARLAGTPAEACDVAEIRVIGVSSQGNYYEARCSAPGEGFLLRIAREEQAEEVRSCAEVAGRSTACELTVPRARSDG